MTVATSSCQFPPPTRASPPSSSFVSELSLVRLALNSLQGVLLLLAYRSSLMDYALSQLTTHQRGSCKVGENEKANNKSHYTLVNQAFAIAVRKVLEGSISGLDTLCASAELRRSSNIVVL
ncbi:hypothetical protein IGI04_013782 [Brassica rapa subsp. trilocularis]|uniref:Uncharacterized protein n=1 Tax=Brassica rapa subsp. trilocularis TaxID=1813537 RepID=A0ABQ7N9T2_BRACM|nr:hypothetical protein IGI04_013782 [Brassica rapa subsp. trilocularis]